MFMISYQKKWKHPGGKLRELGATALDDSELLAILISTGTKGRSAPVIVAKTTYLLGLGDLLEKRAQAIRIPVYLADSVRPPEEKLRKKRAERQADIEFPSPLYVVPLDGDGTEFPEDLALSGELYDRAIELCAQYASSTAHDKLASEGELTNFLRRNEPTLVHNPAWPGPLYELFKVLRSKIRERKDTIWAYVLKNVFKPLLKVRLSFPDRSGSLRFKNRQVWAWIPPGPT
jgi:hypothetical protein